VLGSLRAQQTLHLPPSTAAPAASRTPCTGSRSS